MLAHGGQQGNVGVSPFPVKDLFNGLQIVSDAVKYPLDLHGIWAW